jgi:hypothetical protein
MMKILSFLIVFVSFTSFSQEEREIMYRIYNEETDECGYVNVNGDTLIPLGTVFYCFSDSTDFAIIENLDMEEGFPAIDSKGDEVFRVFAYDNGPDYIEEGMFRIIKNGLIGYATEAGEIIVPPTYEAAWPFENGRALVSLKAEKVQLEEEHWTWVEEDPFYIDKFGNRHENQADED